MKRILFFLLAMLAGCQTLNPPKTCKDLAREVNEANRAAGRIQVDGGTDDKGATVAIYWDQKSPTAQLEALTPPGYVIPEGANLTEVDECTYPGKGPDADPTVWKHYQKTLPVKF